MFDHCLPKVLEDSAPHQVLPNFLVVFGVQPKYVFKKFAKSKYTGYLF